MTLLTYYKKSFVVARGDTIPGELGAGGASYVNGSALPLNLAGCAVGIKVLATVVSVLEHRLAVTQIEHLAPHAVEVARLVMIHSATMGPTSVQCG